MKLIQSAIHKERKYVHTTGTVPVPWAGHFQYIITEYIFQIKYKEPIVSNSTRKLSWFKITKMLIAV